MGWGSARFRPLGNPYGRSASRWMRGRVLCRTHEIAIREPMKTGYRIEGPGDALSLDDQTDLYHRVYLKATSGRQLWQRTIKVEAAIYYAVNVSGDPPDANTGTWSLVPNSTVANFAANLALSPFEQFVSPDDADISKEYVDLKTTIWQDPKHWEQSFEIVHELWANAYVRGRPSSTDTKAGVIGKTHYHVDLKSKRKPFGRA